MAESDTASAFAMAEMRGWSLVQIAGWHDSTEGIEQDIVRVCGISPPAEVGDVAVAGGISLIRVGPGRIWLIDESGEVAARLAGAIDSAQGSVTPLGEGRRHFQLSGNRVPELMQSWWHPISDRRPALPAGRRLR
jgi:heterotetrameric sarcosine oxidase gamma subunit